MASQDFLQEDPVREEQRYVLVSFLSPEKTTKKKSSTLRGLKVRGVFSTREEAEEYSRYLRDKVDNMFDIYVGEVGKWLPWDCSEKVENEHYQEKELNDLMRAYREQRDLDKKDLEKRRLEAVLSSKRK